MPIAQNRPRSRSGPKSQVCGPPPKNTKSPRSVDKNRRIPRSVKPIIGSHYGFNLEFVAQVIALDETWRMLYATHSPNGQQSTSKQAPDGDSWKKKCFMEHLHKKKKEKTNWSHEKKHYKHIFKNLDDFT